MEMIVADSDGYEIGYLPEEYDVDIDLGGENDFQITMPLSKYGTSEYQMKYKVYVPGTEYGGIIEEIEPDTKSDTINLLGDTWRGMLTRKIIEPPSGSAYLVVSGDAHDIIRDLVNDRFDGLFTVTASESGFVLNNYQFERYINLLDGIEKMLATVCSRLCIKYVQDGANLSGHVELTAVRQIENDDEISQDSGIYIKSKNYQRGINHLICLGKGELTDRLVVHLYVNHKGEISTTQYYSGLSERVATYEYSNVENRDELITEGTKRLEELKNYSSFEMSIDEESDIYDLGEVVSGREYITGIVVKKPITRKILKIQKGTVTAQYEIKG